VLREEVRCQGMMQCNVSSRRSVAAGGGELAGWGLQLQVKACVMQRCRTSTCPCEGAGACWTCSSSG
jgi:hypothetical protein